MALAAANTILMQEHAIFSVISPEGCASILWRDNEKNEDAADALKLTAADLLELGVIDQIIDEPTGGAHRNKQAAIDTVGTAIKTALADLAGIDGGILKSQRREKFLKMGGKGLS
jgi:acetyl-CoA carboxylase carboxyl transferase subunit alpha